MEERRTDLMPDPDVDPASELSLIARHRGRELARLALPGGRARVGSAPDNDLVIDDTTVSRRHLEIECRPGGLWVRDVGSRNGTRYQGAKVREVLVPVGGALLLGRVELRVEPARQSLRAELGSLSTQSPPMARALKELAKAATSQVTVLLEGETGTGKELAANALHQASDRKRGPFEVVDCRSLSSSLAGSDLFGHVRGAFTGADRDRAGAFERAAGGTVFLDEVGELSLELQPLLLRVLETRQIRRIGSEDLKTVDARIVASTTRDLEADAKTGRFRNDLLHRLSVVRVTLPPLRDRIEDIPLIARAILDKMGGRAEGVSVSPDTVRAWSAYQWPGNVRELRNLIERAVALGGELAWTGDKAKADADDWGPRRYQAARRRALETFERDFAEQLLARHGGNVSRAADEAGIGRVYLHRLIRKHGIKAKKR